MGDLTLQNYQAVLKLEQEILKHPQVEIPVTHDFCAGIYARTIEIPAGTVLTGHIHADECFFLVRSGNIAVTTDDDVVEISAGAMLFSKAGTKRAGYALTDCVITTFHHNPLNEKSPEVLWNMFTVQPPVTRIESSEVEL